MFELLEAIIDVIKYSVLAIVLGGLAIIVIGFIIGIFTGSFY